MNFFGGKKNPKSKLYKRDKVTCSVVKELVTMYISCGLKLTLTYVHVTGG